MPAFITTYRFSCGSQGVIRKRFLALMLLFAETACTGDKCKAQQHSTFFYGTSIFLKWEFYFTPFFKIGYSKKLPNYDEFVNEDYKRRKITMRAVVPSDSSFYKETFFNKEGYIIRDEYFYFNDHTFQPFCSIHYSYNMKRSVITITRTQEKEINETILDSKITFIVNKNETIKLYYGNEHKIDSAKSINYKYSSDTQIINNVYCKYDVDKNLLIATCYYVMLDKINNNVLKYEEVDIENYEYGIPTDYNRYLDVFDYFDGRLNNPFGSTFYLKSTTKLMRDKKYKTNYYYAKVGDTLLQMKLYNTEAICDINKRKIEIDIVKCKQNSIINGLFFSNEFRKGFENGYLDIKYTYNYEQKIFTSSFFEGNRVNFYPDGLIHQYLFTDNLIFTYTYN